MRNHSFKTFENKFKNNIDTDAYMEIIQENIISSLLLPLDSCGVKSYMEFCIRCHSHSGKNSRLGAYFAFQVVSSASFTLKS